MTKPLPLKMNPLTWFHPVSNCYVEDVFPFGRSVTEYWKGGILLSGLDNGINYVLMMKK